MFGVDMSWMCSNQLGGAALLQTTEKDGKPGADMEWTEGEFGGMLFQLAPYKHCEGVNLPRNCQHALFTQCHIHHTFIPA
jgi:hypothetical protein